MTDASTSARVRKGRSSFKPKLAYLFGMYQRDIHVFTERVGGGFGGKQEMVTEDLAMLGAIKTGRPVMWEFTRPEQFTSATTRHQMTTHVKLGAKKDGTLTALQVRVVSNTGGYGGHGGETLGASMGDPLATLSLPQQEGRRLRRLHQHGSGRRLPRLRFVANDVRHRVRDGRTVDRAQDGPLGLAPQEFRSAGRSDRIRLARAGGCELRQLRTRSMHRHH